jgi:hypothetical protein
MHIIRVGNVNEALYRGVQLMAEGAGLLVAPRGARTLEWPEPVATVYEKPIEKVLFNKVRDANPFFHFFESLWMLAGRNDVEFVKFFNKRMSEYSDDQEVLYGAYGFRWRNHFRDDQLDAIAKLLKNDPTSRRAVLAMWDADSDMLMKQGKDIPCNTHVYFKLRNNQLNMTVCNRSNDMVWGAYGANAVHMSFLLEYMALRLNVNVGVYTQISDSFHVYLEGPGGELWSKLMREQSLLADNHYDTRLVQPYPITQGGAEADDFEEDLTDFFAGWDQRAGEEQQPDHMEFRTPFFNNVVTPMFRAWRTKNVTECANIAASDWRLACTEWFDRRKK